MKKIIIIRHAKSDWETGVSDFDRSLNIRGLKAASYLSTVLKRMQVTPGYVICSPSKRTSETATLLLKQLFDVKKIDYQESIYNATFFEIFKLITSDLDDTIENLVIVGHNPGVSELVEYLSSANLGCLSSCSCVCLSTDLDSWQLASKDMFSMEWNIYPKMFSF